MKKTYKLLPILILLLFVSACTAGPSTGTAINYSITEEAQLTEGMENQPQSSYWFPEDLLEWNFADDKDAKFNVSTVELQDRVDKKELEKSNETQDADFRVVALSIMNGSTSGNVPRGLNTFKANVSTTWQYIDQLVYWGGSSGEGIIVPPSADVIDAAHKNGVPVLGTVFFPPAPFGGKTEWLDTFLAQDDAGNFPIIAKLNEVAEAYGFEGWFINQETETDLTKDHADAMIDFIKAYKASTDLELMWYDAMTVDGKMEWQNALTDQNKDFLVDMDLNPIADSMFLNFWWTNESLAEEDLLRASVAKAKELGIDPYTLFAGIDVQARGFNTPIRWNLFVDENKKPLTSLGLYVPSWTHFSTNNPEQFFANDQRFWINGFNDPRKSVYAEDAWNSISTFALEQTSITKFPFKTNFNVGNGYNYFIKGEKVSSLDWNNRSMQDIMPTYRWIVDHEGSNDFEVYMDYADAYNGGNGLRLYGNFEKDAVSRMKLYATKVELSEDFDYSAVIKADQEMAVNLVLGFEDGTETVFEADNKAGTDYTTLTFDVKDVAGKVLRSISLEFASTEDAKGIDVRLGELAILPKDKNTKLETVSGEIEDVVFDEEESNFAGVRLVWETKEDDASYYEIYRINQDKSRSFLGATPANTHYLNALERNDDTNKTNLVIVAVDQFGNRGKDSELITIDWPDNSVPKPRFTASRTLIAPGDTVTFENTSSQNTESVEWTFAGGNIDSSTDDKVDVTFAEEGKYTVKLVAKNAKGSTELEIEDIIYVTNDAKGDLALLSQGADTEASSYVHSGEAPEFAVNGSLSDKWCAVGEAPHYITIDLGEDKLISEVYMAHAEAGGENPDMNTRAYKIEVSQNGIDFEQVVRVLNNSAAESVDTFAPTMAGYVRVTIDKPTQGSDTAVRLYEIQVFGLE